MLRAQAAEMFVTKRIKHTNESLSPKLAWVIMMTSGGIIASAIAYVMILTSAIKKKEFTAIAVMSVVVLGADAMFCWILICFVRTTASLGDAYEDLILHFCEFPDMRNSLRLFGQSTDFTTHMEAKKVYFCWSIMRTRISSATVFVACSTLLVGVLVTLSPLLLTGGEYI